MNHARPLQALYHLARADFLERTRRPSFLVMLAAVVWLGYAATTGMLTLRVPPNYVGEPNSPWIGALMAVTASLFLGWFGFYLVKGSVSRDYETGVGQIIAATPLSRPLYAAGKWLSNLAVLGAALLILAAAGAAMALAVVGTPVDVPALLGPLLLLALPCLALVSALAVFFDAVPPLRGGFGNVVYLFLFALLLIPAIESRTYQPLWDVAGIRLIGDGIQSAARAAHPESSGGFAVTLGTPATGPTWRFVYDGIAWSPTILGSRLSFVLLAFGVTLFAASLFDRFNGSRAAPGKRRRGTSQPSHGGDVVPATGPMSYTPLTPLPRRLFRFGALYAAELKLLARGPHLWWYAVAFGLVVAQAAAGGDTTRTLLAIAWLWPVLLLSGLGSREMRHNTHELVFSAPRPVVTQLPAMWLAALTVVAVLGSGAFLRFLVDGDTTHLLAWLGGALFIPSLALGVGVLTGSGKAFEVVYVGWIYIILQGVRPLDFVGVSRGSPWHVYVLLTPVLTALAFSVRHWRLASGRVPP